MNVDLDHTLKFMIIYGSEKAHFNGEGDQMTLMELFEFFSTKYLCQEGNMINNPANVDRIPEFIIYIKEAFPNIFPYFQFRSQ